MKHLTHKLAVSFLVTSVALPSVNAHISFQESSGVRLSTSAVPQALNKHADPLHQNFAGLLKRLSTGDAKIESAILSGANLQKEGIKLKKLYKKLIKEYNLLKASYDSLSESEKQLNIENSALNELIKLLNIENADLSESKEKLNVEIAALKTEQEKHNAEQQSAWKQFKKWIFNLDVTKVTTSLITGLVTVISTLLIILM